MVHFLKKIEIFKGITDFGRSLFCWRSIASIFKSTRPYLVQDLISSVMAFSPRPFIKLPLAQQDRKIGFLKIPIQFAVSQFFLDFQDLAAFVFHHGPVHRVKVISTPIPLVFCITGIFAEHFPHRPIVVFFHGFLV